MADVPAAEKNLRRKVRAWREALRDLVLYFLPPEYGGADMTDLGIMCGNTMESLAKAKEIARRSGFSPEVPAFDVDGDGATTSWDVEAWLDDPSRSPVPELSCRGEGGCSFDYGVTNGDRIMQEEYLRGELQRLRAMEADLLHEMLAGEFDKVGTLDRDLRPMRENLALARTEEFLGRAGRRDGWPAAAALAAIGVARGAAGVLLVGYAWQVLRGGWTPKGVVAIDAGVQAAEAQRTLSLQRWPLWNDLRRFGDRWKKDANCPDEAPVIDDGPSGLVERVHRWGRALADPFTRWFFGGALLAPMVHDAAVLTWWRRAVSDADSGKAKPGRPVAVRLTRIAPVPGFSDDEGEPTLKAPAGEATPKQAGLASPLAKGGVASPRALSAPAASAPSAAGAPRAAAPPMLEAAAPAPPARGVEIGPPGRRTYLHPEFEIRERVPEPIDPAKVEAALRGEEGLMSQREFEAFQALRKLAQEKATGMPAGLTQYEQAALAEYEKALAKGPY